MMMMGGIGIVLRKYYLEKNSLSNHFFLENDSRAFASSFIFCCYTTYSVTGSSICTHTTKNGRDTGKRISNYILTSRKKRQKIFLLLLLFLFKTQ